MAILPFILLVSSSFTEESTLLTQGYSFIPRKFSAYAYEYLFSSNGIKIFRAYGVTFAVTIIGTGDVYKRQAIRNMRICATFIITAF